MSLKIEQSLNYKNHQNLKNINENTFAKPMLDKKELSLIKEVLDSGMLFLWKKADMFEKFSRLVNSKYSTSVSSCIRYAFIYFIMAVKKMMKLSSHHKLM